MVKNVVHHRIVVQKRRSNFLYVGLEFRSIFVKNNTMRFLKRLYLKMRLAYRKQYYTQQNQEKYQRAPLFICMKLLKIEDSLLLIAPVSDDKYIYNERLGILVSLLGHRGSIIDRTYSYDINLSNKDWDKLDKLFSNEMQKRTKKIEEQIVSNVKHSLDNIYKRINKDMNKSPIINLSSVSELN
jgi:hypothetical protein